MSLDRQALQTLKCARDLLSDPSRWCKRTRARNMDGEPRSPHSREATQWDLSGALERCTTGVSSELRALAILQKILKSSSIGEWNDNASHEQLMHLFTNAIIEATLQTQSR